MPVLWEEARREYATRREVACHFAHLLYERTDLDCGLEAGLRLAERPDDSVDIEGVVGLVVLCARTCLSNLIRTTENDGNGEVRHRAAPRALAARTLVRHGPARRRKAFP